jgi:hypothetical protein
MAKNLSIPTSHTFTTGRGETETVEHALAWLASKGYELTPGDLLVYAVRRLRALSKDNARIGKGVLASRLYSPRLVGEKVPKALVAAVVNGGLRS